MSQTSLSPTGVERVPFRSGELVVYRLGEGEPVVYLHGMLGNPGIHPFLEELAASRSVVAPCLPGFTGSSPDFDLCDLYDWVFALSELVDTLELAGLPLVASSVSAMLALELEAIRPGAFAAMALVAPLGLWDETEPVRDLFGERASQQPARLLVDPSKASRLFEDDPKASYEEAVRLGAERYHSRRAAAQLFWPFPEFGLARRIHRVVCPVGLVWGEDDWVAPVSYTERFASLLPRHVGTITVPGAGHAAEWDQPERVCRAALELLSRGA
ncbi:MAG: alpha/beta hydrolase [Acidimicrobiales bacterium]|nr:MAG: alpha/beta hydrolase [Acidimicrobiales bacterium]